MGRKRGACGKPWYRTDWVAELPVQNLLDWLADHLASLYPKEQRIDLHERPIPLTEVC